MWGLILLFSPTVLAGSGGGEEGHTHTHRNTHTGTYTRMLDLPFSDLPLKKCPKRFRPECTKIARFSAVAAAIFTAPPQNRAIFKAPTCAISSAKKIASEQRFSLRLKGTNLIPTAECLAIPESAAKIASERRCAILVHSGSDGSGFRFRFGSWTTLGRGEKTPTPKISALLRKRPVLLRADFVLTKDRKSALLRPIFVVQYTGRTSPDREAAAGP